LLFTFCKIDVQFCTQNQEMLGVRDPVYGWIRFSKAEKAVIDSRYIQRLRFVSQLTSVDHVFPGGTNNRFIHSLGAMKLAGKYMKHLLQKVDLATSKEYKIDTAYYIQLARLAALMHDIGHGPFSHAYDRTVYSHIYPENGHDCHRHAIVQTAEMRQCIEACGVSVDHVQHCWHHPKKDMYGVINAVIEGPLGADRMDFILRDSYFTGTAHLGTISYQRIISNSKLIAKHNKFRLAYNCKCLPDIMQTLLSRVHMYDCVYLHKTSSASSLLIESMISHCTAPLRLIQRTKDLEAFLHVTDHTLLGEIMSSSDPDIQEAKKYCEAYMFRRLPKLLYEHKHYVRDDLVAVTSNSFENTVVTKVISGLDHKIFNEFHILFMESDGKVVDAESALKKIGYTSPFQDYYYVRVYDLPWKNSSSCGNTTDTNVASKENVNHPDAY
jgi:HD superfamily phosphohydrolase